MDQLTTCELLTLFTTYGVDAGGHFMNFLAVFSAYLVAGYVLAGKLSRTILVLLSALLVLVTAMTAIGQYLVQLVAIEIAEEIVRRGVAIGSNAAVAASFLAGPNAGPIALVSPAIQVAACVAAIAFAYSARLEREGNWRSTTRSRPTLDHALLGLPLQSVTIQRGSARALVGGRAIDLWLGRITRAHTARDPRCRLEHRHRQLHLCSATALNRACWRHLRSPAAPRR